MSIPNKNNAIVYCVSYDTHCGNKEYGVSLVTQLDYANQIMF